MKEHKVILKDLQKYLKKRGIKTEVVLNTNIWVIGVFEKRGKPKPIQSLRFHYCIIDGCIAIPLVGDDRFIVPLADPDYKEKFYKFLKDKKWNTIR